MTVRAAEPPTNAPKRWLLCRCGMSLSRIDYDGGSTLAVAETIDP
jgi:hypothetical protein